MGMCKEAAVKIVKINDEAMKQIKEILEKETDINFEESKEGVSKPPVMLLAFDPEGQINVVTSQKEFVEPVFGPQVFQRMKEVTAVIPAAFVTGKGSGYVSTRIGGESLTDIWPW
jgi:hypothetical protein